MQHLMPHNAFASRLGDHADGPDREDAASDGAQPARTQPPRAGDPHMRVSDAIELAGQPAAWAPARCLGEGHAGVLIEGEPVRLPGRFYSPEPTDADIEGLTERPQQVLAWLCSWHHDGHVRERWMSGLRGDEPWLPLSVFRLVGDYIEPTGTGHSPTSTLLLGSATSRSPRKTRRSWLRPATGS